MVFEADAWDSTISFAPGIPVVLGGTLELTFAEDVNLASQLGRTFDLFDWTGVTPTGAFAVSGPYTWDLSKLYTTGEVTLSAVPEPSSAFLAVIVVGVILRARVSTIRRALTLATRGIHATSSCTRSSINAGMINCRANSSQRSRAAASPRPCSAVTLRLAPRTRHKCRPYYRLRRERP
jgi:hypothetical protein